MSSLSFNRNSQLITLYLVVAGKPGQLLIKRRRLSFLICLKFEIELRGKRVLDKNSPLLFTFIMMKTKVIA